MGRVVLEAAVGGRVVRRRDHDAVALVIGATTVVDEDGVRDDGRRRHAVVALEDRLDAFGRQHLERRPLRRAGEGVRVLAQEKRTVDRVRAAVVADRLGDRQDVRLGEGIVKRRAPVPAGAEGDALPRVGRDRGGSCNRLARARGRRSRRSPEPVDPPGDESPSEFPLTHDPPYRPIRGYSTGQGFAFQISLAYCEIVRSLENLPE